MQLHKSIFRLAFVAMAGMSDTVLAQQTEYLSMFDNTDTWQPYVDATYTHDDNLLRIPTSLIGNQVTSDTSWRREAGLVVDEVYSRQQITASVDVNRTTFERLNFIDYVGRDAAANWLWAITNDFSGQLGSSYSSSLTPFTQFHFAQPNLRTQKSAYFNEAWLLTPSWQLHGSIISSALQYDLLSQQFGDTFTHSSEFGINYLSAAGNKIGVQVHRDRGEYPNEQIIGFDSINNNFTQNEIQGNLDYSLDDLTHVQFLGGWLRREHDYFHVRDVSGPTAQLNLSYTPTGKSGINLSVWRSINSTDALTVSYTVNKGESINATWNPTAMIQIGAALKQESMDYTGASVLTDLLPQDRIDTMHNASLNVLYTPFRSVQCSLVLYADHLSSNTPNVAFRDKGVMLNVRLTF